MYLREFEFDLPYQKNLVLIQQYQKTFSVTFEEAQRMDYQNNWKTKRNSFRYQTRCITSMLERLLKPIKNDACKKVIFECYTSPTDDSTIKNISGFLHIPVMLELSVFDAGNAHQKKQMIVQAIVDSLTKYQGHLPFHIDEILSACARIAQNNYKNEWIWKETRKTNAGYARVRVLHDCGNVKLFLDYLDTNSLVLRSLLIASCAPDEWDYCNYLGKLTDTHDTIILTSKAGNQMKFPKN